MPDRRVVGSGRRSNDPKPVVDSSEFATKESVPTPPVKPKPEVEPDRRHFLHKKIGGKKAA